MPGKETANPPAVEAPAPYFPLLWPFGHFLALARATNSAPAKPTTSGVMGAADHVTVAAGALRAWLLALGCVYGLYDGYDYPAFGAASTVEWSWMWPILVRNLVATMVICGFWDWILYFSPLKERLRPFKFNPKYPSFRQIRHDALVTMQASVCGTLVECVLCHLWASGVLHMDRTVADKPIKTLLWALTITHWRVPHFYIIHRMMHPWKTTNIPDLGKRLYTAIHSLHHKSYNPTAFSGTNMHPVEATLYYSAALVAIPFGCHPTIAIGCIIDCAVGAWLGHDGFQWPGNGDYFHQIHHAQFDCNYGTNIIPIDYWVGTYAGSREDIKKIWRNRAAGAEANETPVHPESELDGKVQ